MPEKRKHHPAEIALLTSIGVLIAATGGVAVDVYVAPVVTGIIQRLDNKVFPPKHPIGQDYLSSLSPTPRK